MPTLGFLLLWMALTPADDGRPGRAARHRQVARPRSMSRRTPGHLRRCRRRRRGEGRAAGGRRLPEGPDRVRPARRAHPKGVLLVGPPGTGKTLLARAVAGEAGVPFFSISGSEFVEMFVGVGAARVRDLFEQAREQAPCIIFIDELDALGRARGACWPGGGHDEKEQTLNQLLAELDGFDPPSRRRAAGRDQPAGNPRPGAAARRPLRPPGAGRPARPPGPGRRSCACISKKVAARPPTRCGADRRADAGLHRRRPRQPGQRGGAGGDPARRGRGDAWTTSRGGRAHRRRAGEAQPAAEPAGARASSPITRWAMRWSRMALPGADPVQKVSIIPRGVGALGYTIQRPTEDRFLMGREELQDRMTVLLGGRAAEQLVFGEISTGAADDLVKATEIARGMVARFGMAEEELGEVAYEPEAPGFLGQAEWRPAPLRRGHRRAHRRCSPGAGPGRLRTRRGSARPQPRAAGPRRAGPAGARDPGRG